jgi:5'-nucleotidase/UDP-sugar diphosphatase
MLSNQRVKSIARTVLLMSFLALFLFVSCESKAPQRITILHTNDIHGHFVPEPATWIDGHPLVGGFVALDYYIRLARAKDSNNLLLDAGDLMTGNMICDIEYKGAEGGALIEMMNMVGYDGMVYGNHEFDKPITNARNLAKIADFPILCANLVDSLGKNFAKDKYKIYDCQGLKVGVIGVTYHQMYGMANPGNLMGFYTIDPAKVVNDIVAEIDAPTDLIIVLSHLGYENDVELAKHIKNVDVIVGGHTHKRIETPETVNGVLIVQAGSYSRDLGKLELTVAGDTVQSFSGELITTLAENIEPQPELQAFVDSFATIIDEKYGAEIGQSVTDLKSKSQAESNIGDWLTDVIRRETKSDVAFINSGGIRKDLAAGPITIRDISEMLPFQNYIETFNCTGEELMTILTENARAEGLKTHGILQVSGVTYSWKKQGGDVKLVEVKVGGEKLKKDKIYKIAGIDYVNSNFERYYKIQPKDLKNTGMEISNIIIEDVKRAKIINAKVEGRIRQVE